MKKEASGRISRFFINFQKTGKVKMTAASAQTMLTQIEREFSNFVSNHNKFVDYHNYNKLEYITSELVPYMILLRKFILRWLMCLRIFLVVLILTTF